MIPRKLFIGSGESFKERAVEAINALIDLVTAHHITSGVGIEVRETPSGTTLTSESKRTSENAGGSQKYNGPFAVSSSGTVKGGTAYVNEQALSCEDGTVNLNNLTEAKYVCLVVTMAFDDITLNASYTSSYGLESATTFPSMPNTAMTDTSITSSTVVAKYPIAKVSTGKTITQLAYGSPHVFFFGNLDL